MINDDDESRGLRLSCAEHKLLLFRVVGNCSTAARAAENIGPKMLCPQIAARADTSYLNDVTHHNIRNAIYFIKEYDAMLQKYNCMYAPYAVL
jgi:hypothetical protein